MAFSSDAVPAVVAGVFALLGAGYGSRRELKKIGFERFNERERDFERAQVGYRSCYRKFLTNVAAYHARVPGENGKAVDLASLLDNFWEVSFVGDPAVITELEKYWPAEQRADGSAPEKETPDGLFQAMLDHGSRSLDKQLPLKRASTP